MTRVSATTGLPAIAHNCRVLRERSGSAELCAVVKADAYGHARSGTDDMRLLVEAARSGGATWLATAAAGEALSLRDLGVDCPILNMGTASGAEIDLLVQAGCDIAVWSTEAVETALAAASRSGTRARMHVKLDSGMGRLGAREEEAALALVERIGTDPAGEAVGVMTHFATADEADDSFLREQLDRFKAFAADAKAREPGLIAHAANSAATLRSAEAHLDMVRCGIAIYGLDPFGDDPAQHGLEPALEWRSVIGRVACFRPGDSAGYGRRFRAERETLIATVPVGYADGYRRILGGRAKAIVGGRLVPVVGTVSMDNIALDLGPESDCRPGDEVVLIGTRGEATVLAEDLARAAGTINYEIATGIGGRTAKACSESR